MLRAGVQSSNTHLRAVLEVLSEHSTVLRQLSERILTLQIRSQFVPAGAGINGVNQTPA